MSRVNTRFGGAGRSSGPTPNTNANSSGGRAPYRSNGRSQAPAARPQAPTQGQSKGGAGFINVGSLTTKKGTSDQTINELRNSEVKLWWKVYLPEGQDSIRLKHGDMVFVQLGSFSPKAPDYVVGSVSLPPEDGSGNNS